MFTICGVLLVPWVLVLVEQLHGHAGERSFDASWVGLDVLEAVCLLSVAQLMRRRHRATSPAAAATAAILCMDAWFDTMSAAPQLPYAEALAMACFAELPLAALLGWTAWHSLKWASAPDNTVTTRAAAADEFAFGASSSFVEPGPNFGREARQVPGRARSRKSR